MQTKLGTPPSRMSDTSYLLALHKLVEGKENDLAKEIAKQSIGGFDLMDSLKKTWDIPRDLIIKSVLEYKRVKEAEKKYNVETKISKGKLKKKRKTSQTSR